MVSQPDFKLSSLYYALKRALYIPGPLCNQRNLSKKVSSDCNWTRTHNYLVRKGILNQLAKLLGQFG